MNFYIILDLLSLNADGDSKLYIASLNNDIEEVKRILQIAKLSGILANVINQRNSLNITPLFPSSYFGHVNIVKLLLLNNADVNAADVDGDTPLFAASRENQLEVVKLLLKANADVNKFRKDGATPLYISSQNGHFSVVKTLIENGAKIDQARNDGTTPFDIADAFYVRLTSFDSYFHTNKCHLHRGVEAINKSNTGLGRK